MNWFNDLLEKDEIVYGKDISIEIYEHSSKFPKLGKPHVIYRERGYLSVEGRSFIWGECSGKMVYLVLIL